MKRENLVGKRYGKLTVEEMVFHYRPTENNPQGKTYCKCKCDCGGDALVAAYRLKAGQKQSCGCDTSERRSIAYRKDLTGKKFGRLTVIRSLYGSKVECQCDCGNNVCVSTTDVISGHTQSCGCLQRERSSDVAMKDFSGLVTNYGVRLLCRYNQNEKGQWMWMCECGVCGKHFVALPAKIKNGHITSCGCRKQSSHEQYIEEVLKRENVVYKRQYTTPACRNKQVLLFDFALFQNNELLALIEYDGQQHFKAVDLFGGEEALIRTQQRDRIKDKFCQENGIALHRLPYTMSDAEIEEKVMSIIYP